MRLAFVLIFMAGILGCIHPLEIRTETPKAISSPPRRSDPIGTVGTPLTPIQFLDVLKPTTNAWISVGESRGWILPSDIEPLIGQIDSETPCAGVVSLISSYLPPFDKRYTVGHEAAFLIEGFRKGHYPPALTSAHFHPNKEELRQWYWDWKSRSI